MKEKYQEFKSLHRIYLVLLVSLISVFIIVFFSAMFYSSILKGNQSISNILYEQRILVESMNNDVNRLSLIGLDSDSGENHEANISELENNIKKDLSESIDRYDSNLNNLSEARVIEGGSETSLWSRNMEALQPYIYENIDIWNQFKEEYELVLSDGFNSESYFQSLNYINKNSYRLSEASENLLNEFLDSNMNSYRNINGIIAVSVGFFVLILTVISYETYKYVILPLRELYSGFKKIGFSSLKKDNNSYLESISVNIRQIMDGVIESLNLTQNLSSSRSFDDMLKYIYDSFKDYIPYSHIGIALFKDDDSDIIVGSYGINDERINSGAISDIIGYQASIKDTQLSKLIKNNEARVIDDLEDYVKNKAVSKYNEIMLRAGVKSSITLPLIVNDTCIGFIFFSSSKKHAYENEHLRFLNVLKDSISIAFQQNIFVEDLLYSNLISLTKISESKDKETGNHILRMSEYSVALTKHMKKDSRFSESINYKFIIDIEKFSPMHDVGKVSIPDNIIMKPGKLDKDEFEYMKTHTINGAQVLLEAQSQLKRRQQGVFDIGIEIAETHHEKWDGSGYPNGLNRERIPLSGRIVALADVLDALLSRRPYKEPFSFEKARNIILEGCLI